MFDMSIAGPDSLPRRRNCSSLIRNIRRAFRSPLADYQAYQSLLRDKEGIEIGGPTKLFRRDLPVYKVVRSLDGVNFSRNTVWEGQLVAGQTYNYFKKRVGHQFISDATDLGHLPEGRYDFVLSSNNLEHIANPLKALNEWLRILRPGGQILLVLPRKESNFDRKREVTSFAHLLDDFNHGTTEHDLTHLDEIVESHDYNATPDTPDPESFRRRGLANFENRCLHHHVFDQALISRIFEHLGVLPELQMTTSTDHIAIAQKP
jgi:SAM-dependent methyltransferase